MPSSSANHCELFCLKVGCPPKVCVSVCTLHKGIGVPECVEVLGSSPVELRLRACGSGRGGRDRRRKYCEEDERRKAEHARLLGRCHVGFKSELSMERGWMACSNTVQQHQMAVRDESNRSSDLYGDHRLNVENHWRAVGESMSLVTIHHLWPCLREPMACSKLDGLSIVVVEASK